MKNLKKNFIWSIVMLMIFWTIGFISAGPAKAAEVTTIINYTPYNGMESSPTFTPIDFIFNTELDSAVSENLGDYFSVSPAVDGFWQYSVDTWGDDTMYRVAYVTPNGLATSTTYTVSASSSVFDVDLSLGPDNDIPALTHADGSNIYSFAFTTNDTANDMGGFLAPMVFAGYPSEGMRDVLAGLTTISLTFDKFFDMDATTFSNENIYVKNISTGQIVSSSVSPSTGISDIATVSVSLEDNSQYRVYVSRDVKEINGQAILGMPDNEGNPGPYTYDFFTGASTDIITARYMGTNLDQYASESGIIGVPLSFVTSLSFDNPLLPSTVNSSNITLVNDTASTSVETTVTYNSNDNSVIIIPKSNLTNDNNYTLTITANVQSVSSKPVNPATVQFKTVSTADTDSPVIYQVDADNYGFFVEFSEPMNQALATNKSYYTVKTRASDTTDWPQATSVSLSSANTRYNPENNSVMIDGLSLTPGHEFQITATNAITDMSDNSLDTNFNANVKTGIVMDASLFGGGGGMFSGSGDMDMDDMGMTPINVMPMSNIAGLSTKYFVDIPITSQIPANGTIELKFPSGFDVTGAMKDSYSPNNNDINGPGDGVVGFASYDPGTSGGGDPQDGIGVIGDRTIVIQLGEVATMENDFLTLDLDGIKNSNVPKGFETNGYQVEIRTKGLGGNLLEVLNSMPFFITAGGTNSFNLTIDGVTSGDDGEISVFLDSPTTGPIEKVASFNNSTSATVNFINIPDGQYIFYTEASVTLGSADYSGLAMPEPISITENVTKTISLNKDSSDGGKATITINVNGDFGSESIDFFAASPNDFKIKTKDSAGSNPSTNLYLPDGEWMVGISPSMPKGPMSGPAPMPDWMPPMPVKVRVSDSGTLVKELSGTANDGTIVIDMGVQGETTISGTVVDNSGNGIAKAEVYAYQPNGAFGGSNTKTASDGSFVLKIPVLGTYTVGAIKPGLPSGSEQAINVDENKTGITITIKKPSYTISGKVLNSNGNGISYAPVWASQEDSRGNSNTITDASGSYILYVDSGTWKVETDAPGIGWLEYDNNLIVSETSLSGINIRPTSGLTYHTVSGTVTIGGKVQAYMPIRAVAYDDNGNNLGRSYDAVSNSSGQYSINAPAGVYRLSIWTPGFGEIERTDQDDYDDNPANLNLNGDKSGVNINIASGSLKTVTLKVTNGTDDYEGFVNVEGEDSNYQRSLYISDLSEEVTLQLEDNNNYLFFLDVPGLGEFIPIMGTSTPLGGGGINPDTGNITINGVDRNVIFQIPDTASSSNYVTVNGIASDGASVVENVWVWVASPATGFHKGVSTNSAGKYSLTLPVLSDGVYMIGADKPAYVSLEPSQLDLSDEDGDGVADNDKDFSLTAHSSTISGYIYQDANSNGSRDNGEDIPNGWVYAVEVETGIMSNSPVDGSGAYNLGVSNGTWKVYGAADGYLDTEYKVGGINTAIVVNSNVSNKDIALETDNNWSGRTRTKAITPANGGVIDDTAVDGTGVKVIVPANALGNSSVSGSFNVSQTSSVTKTNSATPFGGQGRNITANDNSGKRINNLNDYINIEMVYRKSDIDAETGAGRLVDFNKLKAMQVGYFDSSLNDWITLSTIRNAYYKTNSTDTQWQTYQGNASSTGFVKFIDDALINGTFTNFEDYKLVFKTSTNHLTIFSVTIPTDTIAPSAPNNLSQTSGNGSSVTLDWDDNTEADLLEYEIYRSTVSGVSKASSQVNTSAITSSTFIDNTTSAFTSYFYTVTAVDDSGNESNIATELQVCSTKNISNGTIDNTCSITCDSGYNKSGNSCVKSTASSSGGSGGRIMPTTYCLDVEFDVWQSLCVSGLQYRNILSRSPRGCVMTDQQKQQTKRACMIEIDQIDQNKDVVLEKKDENLENTAFNQIQRIAFEANKVFKNNTDNFVKHFSVVRNIEQERQHREKYINRIVGGSLINNEIKDGMLRFVTYGTDTTQKLGAGERAGVINSYKSALGKLPQTEAEWSDVIKIANGRWPSEVNKKTESNAEAAFRKVYLRSPDRNNPHDDAAVVVISYGLRPGNRNLDSEKAAIKSFKHIYGYNPVSASAWDIVRAIAYSGATR